MEKEGALLCYNVFCYNVDGCSSFVFAVTTNISEQVCVLWSPQGFQADFFFPPVLLLAGAPT